MMPEAAVVDAAPQIDGLMFDYDSHFVSRLRHGTTVNGERTLAGLLAAAELHATENDLYAARKCIARAFSIYGNPDEANWYGYVSTAIICRQLDVAVWLLNQR